MVDRGPERQRLLVPELLSLRCDSCCGCVYDCQTWLLDRSWTQQTCLALYLFPSFRVLISHNMVRSTDRLARRWALSDTFAVLAVFAFPFAFALSIRFRGCSHCLVDLSINRDRVVWRVPAASGQG